jgi:glycosyl transferase family 1
MRILVIDGPGVHPRSAARALGAGLHHKGHGVIVHPIAMKDLGWFPRYGIQRRVAKILNVHHPDVIHVFTSEPWIADAFTGHGISVVHSTLDQPSRADWVIAPTRKARAGMAGQGPGDNLASCLPYPIEIGDDVPGTGDFVLAMVDRKDRTARKWVDEARAIHPDIPVRYEGHPVEARFVISLSSREEIWPAGLAEAMAASRAVIAGWNGAATEFVLEGVNGYLSAPGDVTSLAAHLRFLWDQPDEAARMGFASRDEAKGHFGGDEQILTLMRWYLRAGVSRLAV